MKRRNTKTKRKILELFSKHHLLSGPKLVAMLPRTNSSTIYRNLGRFVEDGVIKEATLFGLGITKYELVRDQHHHFVCKKCGKVKNIIFDHSSLKQNLPQHYQIEEVEVFVRGMCRECRKK